MPPDLLSSLLPSTPSSTPYRLSEACFRVYEPVILAFVRSWPSPVTFHPAPLRTTTAQARLRDSLLSLRKRQWSFNVAPDFNYEKFNSIYDKKAFLITYTDTTVTIGPRNPTAFRAERTDKSDDGYTLSDWTPQDVIAFSYLLSRGKINGPVRVTPPISSELISSLSSLDVSISQTPTSSIIF